MKFSTVRLEKTRIMIFNLRQYNALHLHEKALLVEQNALFIDHHFSCDCIYTLFTYNHYYIEVTVTSETNNLVNITAFKKGRKLNKYLNDISLSELL